MKIYLNKDSIGAIMNGFLEPRKNEKRKTKRDIISLSSLNGQITNEGVIINSYVDTQSDSEISPEYKLILAQGRVINIFRVNYNDDRVVNEGTDLRVIKGLDENLYLLEAEYKEYKGKIYCIFPNYLIKFDGSIKAVEGSADENFIKLMGIKEKRK